MTLTNTWKLFLNYTTFTLIGWCYLDICCPIFNKIAFHVCRSYRQSLAVPSLLPLTNLSQLLAYWILSTWSYNTHGNHNIYRQTSTWTTWNLSNLVNIYNLLHTVCASSSQIFSGKTPLKQYTLITWSALPVARKIPPTQESIRKFMKSLVSEHSTITNFIVFVLGSRNRQCFIFYVAYPD